MDSIRGLAEGIAGEFQRLLPRQRKTQRTNLSLLVATMLDVRSANLMDLAAGLPRDADRIDMRYQWISRVLMNPLIDPDAVMAPFAREVLCRLAGEDQPLVLILDQSKLSDRHQVLMLAVRYGERALPVLWRVEATEGAIGFAVQKALLDAAVPLLPEGADICLMADRFYGTADLISLCQDREWDYRIRLKGNLVVRDADDRMTTGESANARFATDESAGRRPLVWMSSPWLTAFEELDCQPRSENKLSMRNTYLSKVLATRQMLQCLVQLLETVNAIDDRAHPLL